MVMQGPRTYTLVKVITDSGLYGIGEGYGNPGVGVKEQMLALKPELMGKDPLEIDAIYTGLGQRTDGSAHALMRAVSGIEMALWDLAGKILGVPATTLLGGRFRDRVQVYDHAAPRNMLDPKSCRDWADKVKADPPGFTTHKFGPPRTTPENDIAHDRSNRLLTTKELTQHPPRLRELPRGDRLGPRHDGALPLGIRSAHVDSTCGGRGTDPAAVAGGSAAAGLLR